MCFPCGPSACSTKAPYVRSHCQEQSPHDVVAFFHLVVVGADIGTEQPLRLHAAVEQVLVEIVVDFAGSHLFPFCHLHTIGLLLFGCEDRGNWFGRSFGRLWFSPVGDAEASMQGSDGNHLSHRSVPRTKFLFPCYPMQLLIPSVVAMAVRNEMAICRIVFQVWLFIVAVIFLGPICRLLSGRSGNILPDGRPLSPVGRLQL